MRSVLIVGGDQVDGIKKILTDHGIRQIQHWSGRKPADNHKKIPDDTSFIVLVTKLINHSLTYNIKRAASKRQLKIVYTSNSHQPFQSTIQQLSEQLSQEALSGSCRKTYRALINAFGPLEKYSMA